MLPSFNPPQPVIKVVIVACRNDNGSFSVAFPDGSSVDVQDKDAVQVAAQAWVQVRAVALRSFVVLDRIDWR